MAKKVFRQRGRIIKENEHLINDFIEALEVRLVGENVENKVFSTAEARRMADEQGVDLVIVGGTSVPPVARVVDYNKFLYDRKKKDKEAKANQVKVEMKEIRFTSNTDDHDFEFKTKHAEKFLGEGDKVKAYVQFKGRAIMFKERGELILLKFAERLGGISQLEGMPKLEGKRMHVILVPKKKK
jgi:translation initiation factor IF-3